MFPIIDFISLGNLNPMQKNIEKTIAVPFLASWDIQKHLENDPKNDLTQDFLMIWPKIFLRKMSFANRLSSNNCTVSTVDPKPKMALSSPSGGPVGFSFNARQTKNGFEYPFWLHFFTRYHSKMAISRRNPGYFGFSSPWATRPNGSRQPSKRFASTPTFNDKKIGSDMLYRKQKNIEPTTKPNKFELISVNFHTRN